MIQWLSSKVFAPSRPLQISAKEFNHCSTICRHRGGTLMAWYSGSGECRDDQSVYMIFIGKRTISEPVRIGDCTGNPVLIDVGDESILVWSKFEDTGIMRSLADRWKHCSLWWRKVLFDGNKIKLGDSVQFTEPSQHLLGRCNSLRRSDGALLLPLYDELARECVIYDVTNLQFKEIGRFGKHVIQPTIWEHAEPNQSKICALTRNFGNNQKRALLHQSFDGGVTWDDPQPSDVPNRNNSLQVTSWCGEQVILWNDKSKTNRERMTIGYLSHKTTLEATRIKIVGKLYGAYPSMCVDFRNNLNFTFTNLNKAIERHVWSRRFFKSQRRNNPTRR